ncbi:MAG: hypothetical protein U0Y68_03735 [Blastocatellia bacterium]
MKMQYRSLVIGFVFLGSAAWAQTARPTLTTEDVVKWRAAHPERAEHFIPKTAAAQQPSAPSNTAAQEQDWNARLTEARERVRSFERRADETELAATQARSWIFYGDANALNANNARVAELQRLCERLPRRSPCRTNHRQPVVG